MSHTYYNELWLVTRSDLEKLLELERQLQDDTPVKRNMALNSALIMYIKYRNIVRRLVMCYDQIVQTQKRELIKRILDCAIGRMLECKKEIVEIDKMDYQWPDDMLKRMKFTSDDIELFATVSGQERLEERRTFIQELVKSASKAPQMRERSLSQIHFESMTDLEDETLKTRGARKKIRIVQPSTVEPVRESPEEIASREAKLAAERTMHSAILLIQSYERARTSRCYSTNVKRLYDYNKKLESGEIVVKRIGRARYIKSAVTMQRAWRRYTAKKAIKKRIARLEETLGMTIPSWQSRQVFAKDEENFKRRRALLPVFAARTMKAINDERTRLLIIRGPGLMEDITDEIHEWFVIWYDALGHYDIFPAAKLGGSVLIATGQTLTPQEYLIEKLEKMNQAEQKGETNEKETPVSKDKTAKISGWKMPQTQALSCLEETNTYFIQNWSVRDESGNPEQKEYLDLITDKLCYELQLEMREIVDELMRAELKLLNKALLKDHAGDKQKFTIPVINGDIKKNDIKPDKIKKKKEKDSLGDVAVEDLFNELFQAKIIRNYPTASLRNWFGDLSYQNYEARRESRDYKHRLGEIKPLVLEYCVLPLISKEVHQVAPLVRSVCIYGLPKTGKTLLANAICSETGALLFDISIPVLVGKYMGKKNQQRFIDMIAKVSRVYAPSIIFLDDGEKPWLKKVQPEERYLQPKRFAKYFVKLVKSIKPGDQILFLSLTAEPQRATGAFIRLHDKFILVPTTDYNTLYMYYKDLLMTYHNIDRDIDVSCLAKMSVGIPLDFIKQAVEKVLSLQRRITLKFNPLSPIEIMTEVMKYQYPTMKILEALDKFESQTPLSKKRRALQAEETTLE